MDKLFTNFERLDLKRNRSVEGTGLGLPITKNLLVAMGGDITVSSVYGEGSTFTATVGQEIVNEEQIGDYRKKYKEQLHQEVCYQESFHAEDARILVVDDNEVNLKVVVGLAKNTKLQIDTALSAAEGLGTDPPAYLSASADRSYDAGNGWNRDAPACEDHGWRHL